MRLFMRLQRKGWLLASTLFAVSAASSMAEAPPLDFTLTPQQTLEAEQGNLQMQQFMQTPEAQQIFTNPQFQAIMKQALPQLNTNNMGEKIQQGIIMSQKVAEFSGCIDEKLGEGTAKRLQQEAMSESARQYMSEVNIQIKKLCAAGKRDDAQRYKLKSIEHYATNNYGSATADAAKSCDKITGLDAAMPHPCDI